MASALDHLEKTFSELYRKEIDQEENVWRTQPFFAATIALQFGMISGMLPRGIPISPALGQDMRLAIVLMIPCDLASLACLALSIGARKYQYIAPEPELMRFAFDLDLAEQHVKAQNPQDGFDAQQELKRSLAEDYAVATDHNRAINQRGIRLRNIAGLLILLSVLLTLFFFGRIVLYFLP